MRILLDKDIIKWNKRLSDTPYQIHMHNWNVNSNKLANKPTQSLSVIQRIYTNMMGVGEEVKEVEDPNIKYIFSFSIASNREVDFFDIHSILLKNGIINQRFFNNRTFDLTPDTTFRVDKSIHKIFNKEYIKFSYFFDGNLTNVMSYITILEDAIEFFKKIWGYDENGKEYSLIKYPIGTFVSKNNDKSEDYLVLNYEYTVDQYEHIIKYVISKIDGNPKSLVIKYDKSEIIEESNLSYSRNERINNILN